MVLEKINPNENLRKSYPKLNNMIDEVNTFQKQINEIVVEGDSSVEAAQARVKQDGTTYESLRDRLNDTDSILEVKANADEVRLKSVKVEPEDWSERALALSTGQSTINLLTIPQNNSVTPSTLTKSFRYRGNIASGVSVNTATSDGIYLVLSGALNLPSNFPANSSGIIINSMVSDRWLVQDIYVLNNPSKRWNRNYDTTGSAPVWEEKIALNTKAVLSEFINDKAVLPSHLSDGYDFKGTITSGLTSDKRESGVYVVASATDMPSDMPAGIMRVHRTSNRWITQELLPLTGSGSIKYGRAFDINGTVHPWGSANPAPMLLTGKKVVNFGDSRIGNRLNAESVSYAIAQKTGATVYNCGFGGTRMSTHDQYWDAFSMYRLADEIVKDSTDATKWVLQDDALANDGGILPWQFDTNLSTLKGIDFNTVDYITIDLGTNDWTANKPINNDVDLYDVSTFKGALRYSLEKIIAKYRHLKVMIVTPTYRFWVDGTTLEFIEDSDTKLQNGVTLDAFVQSCKDVAKEYKLPCLDNYHELGFNKFNRTLYFDGADGTHPNVTGNARMGNKYGSALISNF